MDLIHGTILMHFILEQGVDVLKACLPVISPCHFPLPGYPYPDEFISFTVFPRLGFEKLGQKLSLFWFHIGLQFPLDGVSGQFKMDINGHEKDVYKRQML